MKLKVLPPRTALIAAAALLFLIGWILYVPPIADLRRLSRDWWALKTEQEGTRRLLDRFYGEKIGLIPEAGKLPQILEILHEKARRHQVEILAVSPGAIPGRGPGEPVFCPVELQLEGEYRALGEFLGELRDPSKIGRISIRQIRIGREEGLLPRLRAQLSMEIALQ